MLPGKPVKLVRCFNPDKFGDLEKLITSHKGVWDGSSSDENGKMVPFMWPLKSRSLWARIEKVSVKCTLTRVFEVMIWVFLVVC